MAVANRALSAPLNIHGDHSDSMAERDSGWVQIYCENAQEVYDSVLQAFRIAEHLDVQLPVMVGLDGFTNSHTLENLQVLSEDVAGKFVGNREFPVVLTHEGKSVPYKLDPESPMTMGPVALPNYYFEFKRQQEEAMRNSLKVIQQIHDEYAQLSGRHYGDGLLERYKLEDADMAILCAGSTAGTVKTVVDELRAQGVKAGLLRLRTFRPFPAAEIVKALEKTKAVAVMDRSMSFGGNGGALFHETRHALYDTPTRPYVVNCIYGLGGRDTNPTQIRNIYEDLQKMLRAKRVEDSIRYVGLRE
jgi:pyruvate ferredoxin oxidoreductase alpha subunit